MTKPNILFIFSDQQHWEAMGSMAPSFHTPHLDRLYRESVQFSHAFCTTPQCSPSRSTLMTGLYPSKTGVQGNVGNAGGLPLRMKTIGGHLQAAGYRTGYFGKWHLGKDAVGTAGWDEDWGVTGPEERDDEAAANRAMAFIQNAATAQRPFACYMAFDNPHDIYEFDHEVNPAPKVEYPLPDTWHAQDWSRVPSIQETFMREDQGQIIHQADRPAWLRYRECYREKVNLLDQQVGRVLKALDQSGAAQDTVVVFTSDHGDMDTQHRCIYKGPFMYEHVIRVPLMFRLPAGMPCPRRGHVVDALTINADLFPTLCELAGIVPPENNGRSLKPLLTGEGPQQERSFIVGQYYSKQQWVNPIRMIRTRQHKYNTYGANGEELYDLEHDPGELRNLARDPALASTKSQLSAQLMAWMKANDDPFSADSAPA